MNLFPLSKLNLIGPDWSALSSGELLSLSPGDAREATTAGATRYVIVAGGRVRLRLDGMVLEAGAGDVALVPPGVSMAIPGVLEATELVVLLGRDLPPFAAGEPPILLPPQWPAAPSRLRGVSAVVDPSATFSPGLLEAPRGVDLALTANLGAMITSQIREIRTLCQRNAQLLAFLCLPVEDDEHAATYFDDPEMQRLADAAQPAHVGFEADLTTAAGIGRVEGARRGWAPWLHRSGRRMAIWLTLRPWSVPEQRSLYQWLAGVSPAHIGLVLRWDPAVFPGSPAHRRVIDSLLPWTLAMEHPGAEGFEEFCHLLEGRGFQGWALRRVGR